ncbi:MAG: restriction endonuclease [Rhodococcus sp. (in: high G+C Gram-positive bacteria)]
MKHRRRRPEPDWQRFERLVAALHQDRSAVVRWDEQINGRQFDVTIRFRYQDYEFLTIIEVRKKTVTASEVDAFVTKTRDVNANKAIIVSAKNFQRGAKSVAHQHGIELFTLTQLDELPDWMVVIAISPMISIDDVALENDGETEHYPTSNDELTYLMHHTEVALGDHDETLEAYVEHRRETWEREVGPSPVTIILPLPAGSVRRRPFHDDRPVTAIHFTAQLTNGKVVDTGGFDPNLAMPSFLYRNEQDGSTRAVPGTDLPLGLSESPRAGHFYRHPFINQTVYVEQLVDGWATIHVVESYQHGDLLQCSYRQRLQPPFYALEITDDSEVTRLTRMYEHFRSKSVATNGPTNPVRQIRSDEPCFCQSGRSFAACHGRILGNAPGFIIQNEKPAGRATS